MKNKVTKTILAAMLATTIAGCDIIPGQAYFNRGNPESLLDQSSEIVNFELSDYNSLDELLNWVNQDQPTRAEIYCMDNNPICMEAEQVLQQFGVASVFVASPDNRVTLVYDRVIARDCENRYIENGVNPYNFNHPTFGCANASNMVQMVTDKRQFTAPALLELPDAERIDRVMRGYRLPYDVKPPVIDGDFETQLNIQTNSQ
jgi:Type IV pili component